MILLRYGNTNTYLIPGSNGYLLLDTDYAGTLPAFYRSLKERDIQVKEIEYVLATHYHPDHCGLIGALQLQGVELVLMEEQVEYVHFPDAIFQRDGVDFVPADEKKALVLRCADSRAFLRTIGIQGEIVSTPSHSRDSVSILLDSGDCFVGDLQRREDPWRRCRGDVWKWKAYQIDRI